MAPMKDTCRAEQGVSGVYSRMFSRGSEDIHLLLPVADVTPPEDLVEDISVWSAGLVVE